MSRIQNTALADAPLLPEATRTDRRKAQTRAHLLEAAAHVMGERGFHDARVHEIAERADVGTGTFYNYFRSKDEIFEALTTDTMEGLAAHLDAARDDALDARERLWATWRAVFEYADRHRDRFRVFFGEGQAFHTFIQRSLETFAADIQEEMQTHVASGAYRPCNTHLLATAFVGMASHVVSWWLDHPDVSIDDAVDEICLFEWYGLSAAAAAATDEHTSGGGAR